MVIWLKFKCHPSARQRSAVPSRAVRWCAAATTASSTAATSRWRKSPPICRKVPPNCKSSTHNHSISITTQVSLTRHNEITGIQRETHRVSPFIQPPFITIQHGDLTRGGNWFATAIPRGPARSRVRIPLDPNIFFFWSIDHKFITNSENDYSHLFYIKKKFFFNVWRKKHLEK